MTDTQSPVKAGDVIDGKYCVERMLGAGGMGVVVVATHLQLEQKVAIKFLLPAVAKQPEAVARFAREARAAAKIQSEHVARVLDVATHENGSPYMVMEFLEGRDLEGTLEEHGALPVDRVVDYVLQALEALAEAHVAGIVHRDLKPANMFLARRADGSSVVKILDFGISKVASDKSAQLTSESAQMGSPLYMSPEQLRRTRDVDARADIWAVGVILHELLTGEAPFIAETLPEIIAGILSLPPLRLRLHHPEIPVELEEVVLRCLEKDRDKRFPDVAQLAMALRPFAPEGSLVSVERIVRVIGGRKEISLPPASTSRAAATHAGLEASTRFVDPIASSAVTQAGPAAETFEPEPPSIDASWQTTGKLGPSPRVRRAWILAVAAAAVAVAAGAGVWVQRSSAPATPATATPSAPALLAPVVVPLEVPASAAPPAAASPAPSSAPVAPVASATAPATASPARPSRPSGTATAPAPTRGGGRPAPAVPGADDFGGRK